MSNKKNGKTQKISGGHQDSGAEGKHEPVGNIQQEGGEPGTNEISIGGEDSEWRDWVSNLRNQHPDFAKVLERLHGIESKYLNYVDAHQGRLKARLQESLDDKAEFLRQVRGLEADILGLVKEQESQHDE